MSGLQSAGDASAVSREDRPAPERGSRTSAVLLSACVATLGLCTLVAVAHLTPEAGAPAGGAVQAGARD
jgi:hypothetical protein